MRIGCCGSMICPEKDPVGIEILEPLAELGYDYIELSLRDLAVLPPADFENLRRRVERAPIACESCNNLIPPPLRVTGRDADVPRVMEYIEEAFSRAEALGAESIVFGSPLSKNVENGFPWEIAYQQLLDFAQVLGDAAARHGLFIAMEPINAGESNLLVSAKETCEFVRRADHPHIRLLVDYYHLGLDGETPDVLLEAGPWLQHIHFSGITPRAFPKSEEEDAGYAHFLGNLIRAGYESRISIEAYTRDFRRDAKEGLAFMRSLIGKLEGECRNGDHQ